MQDNVTIACTHSLRLWVLGLVPDDPAQLGMSVPSAVYMAYGAGAAIFEKSIGLRRAYCRAAFYMNQRGQGRDFVIAVQTIFHLNGLTEAAREIVAVLKREREIISPDVKELSEDLDAGAVGTSAG